MFRLIVIAAAAAVIGFGMAPPAVADSHPTAPGFAGDAPRSPASQQNAVDKAQDYLDLSPFSREGLIKQLAFEGFSIADATSAVDSLAVDWNEQAAKKARDYLDLSSFSEQGLLNQLEFEGFTPSQATYGVSVAYR